MKETVPVINIITGMFDDSTSGCARKAVTNITNISANMMIKLNFFFHI